jgi:retron-type reverse transcriptase
VTASPGSCRPSIFGMYALRLRPLGIAALEDKILQRAVVEVLNAIYETDFLGFSHGFRPGRSPHHALDALAFGITRKKVGWCSTRISAASSPRSIMRG